MPEDYDVRPLAGPLLSALSLASHEGKLPITYGDLSEIFFGHRRSGQAFGYWLGNIHSNVQKYNLNNKLRGSRAIPYINEAVIQVDSRQVGEGAPGITFSPDETARRVALVSLARWRAIGAEIGYDLDKAYRNFTPKRGRLGKSPGQRGRGIRSEAAWEARQSPIVDEFIAECASFFDLQISSTCDPDIFLRRKSDGLKVLIEVKPDCGTHNIITAIGQCLAYGHFELPDVCVIAGPGFSFKQSIINKYSKLFLDFKIRIIDTDRNILSQMKAL